MLLKAETTDVLLLALTWSMIVDRFSTGFTTSLLFAAVILVSPAFGQQPAADASSIQPPGTTDQTPANAGAVAQPKLLRSERPASPEEIRKKQIDAYDPLAKDPRVTDTDAPAEKTEDASPRASGPKPLPGSVAESNLAPSGREGPQILEGEAGLADQQYNGPAVLSRSYTLTRPTNPRQLKWNWTVGAGEIYTVGLITTPVAATTGTTSSLVKVPAASSFGNTASFTLHGRHIWRRDQIAVDYTANYNHYATVSAYNGSNQVLNFNYSHQFSRHLELSVIESASTLSQSGTLQNPFAESGLSVANINLGASPTVQPLDSITRQTTTQIMLTWQKTARLSFSYSGGIFGVERTGIQLSGDSGYQAQTDMNYRLTRKTTVGVYYSYLTYVFSHHLSDSDTHTTGLIYSYALGRSTQLRTRAGISRVENQGLTQLAIAPAIAALVGQSFGIVDSYSRRYTSDISGQLVKDFGESRTGNISYAHGVSPGNGAILTSTQQAITGSFSMVFFRHYTAALALGQFDLSATLATTGRTVSDYASLTFTRPLPRNVSANLAFSYRTYSMTGIPEIKPQYLISSGFTWGPGEGKLW